MLQSQTEVRESEINAAASAEQAKLSEISAGDHADLVMERLAALADYTKLLESIRTLLSDYTYEQILRDANNDPVLDSAADAIGVKAIGFEAFIQVVFELVKRVEALEDFVGNT